MRLDAIGDFVLFTSVLPVIRKQFGGDDITLAVSPLVATIAEGCPYIDHLVSIDLIRYTTEMNYIKKVTTSIQGRYDIIINAQYTRTWQSDNIVARSRAPMKYGFDCIDKDGEEKRRAEDRILYTDIVPTNSEWEFELVRYENLLSKLTGVEAPKQLVPDLWISSAEKRWVVDHLRGLGVEPSSYAVLSPGAGAALRYWGGENFASIARLLVEKHHMKVLIVGSETDKTLATEIMRHFNRDCIDICGTTNLRQLTALIAQSRILVGTESSSFHLAWANGIPSVCVAGGGHFDRFLPKYKHVRIVNFPMDCYRCYWNCIYDEVKCITSITPAMVSDAVEELLH